MAEFKVRDAFHLTAFALTPAEWPTGSRDVRGMLCKNTSERLRGVLLRPEGRPPSNGSPL